MPEVKKTPICIWSNNIDLLNQYLLFQKSDLVFKKHTHVSQNNYLLILVDLECDVTDLTSNIYPLLSEAAEKKNKVLVCFSLSAGKQTALLDKYLGVMDTLYEKKINLRTVVVYDLYTLQAKQESTSLDKYLVEVISTKKIEISKKNSVLYYPISLSQSIMFFEKLLFLNSTLWKNYTLAGYPISDSDLAYLLNKNSQEVCGTEIDISLSANSKETYIPYQRVYETQADLNLKTDDDFGANLKKYLCQTKDLEYGNGQTQDYQFKKSSWLGEFLKKITKRKIVVGKEQARKWAIDRIESAVTKLVLILVLIFGLSSLLFVGSSYYTLKSLESAAFNLKKGDLTKVSSYYQKSALSLNVVNTNLHLILPIINLTSQDLSRKSLNLANFLSFTVNTFEGLTRSYVLSEKVYNSLNSPHSLDYKATLLAIKSNLQQSYESLNQIEILLDGIGLPRSVYESIRQNAEYENLTKIKDNLWEVSKLIDVLPSLLGTDKNTNIFILVQNHNELRSTGGVIEIIYHLSLEKGKVVFLKPYVPQEIESFSDLSINPPPLVEKITGDSNWRLKDMNYNPDFVQTATNIAWYIENKIKTKPDYILGLNLKVVESLLSKTTPYTPSGNLPSYEEFVSNLQTNSKPEQTKSVVDLFVNKILNHEFLLFDLFSLLSENQQNYTLWSGDVQTQSLLINNPISKNIDELECLPAISTSRKCLPLTLHINFSNFSSIPLNGYLERELLLTSTPQVLTVENQLKITSKYTKNTPLINRNLVEVVQFYAPKNSNLNSIQVDDKNLNLDEVITQTEKTLNRYQFITSTPLNKDYILTINFTNQLSEKTVLPIAYSYSIIPQAGQDYKKQTLEINLPQSTRVSAITNKIDSYPDKIIVDLTKTPNFGYNLVSK